MTKKIKPERQKRYQFLLSGHSHLLDLNPKGVGMHETRHYTDDIEFLCSDVGDAMYTLIL